MSSAEFEQSMLSDKNLKKLVNDGMYNYDYVSGLPR